MMLSSKVQQQAAVRPASRAAAVSLPRARRSACVVRAAEETKQEGLTPESFQEKSGFVAYDSAGQSNMYPVMTKAYAEQAPTPAANATIGIALAAASVGIGAIAIGLSALSKTGTGVVDLSQFKSLTDYAAAFAAEL